MVSNLVSNRDTPAFATPPSGVTVHKPDLRLEFDNRQVDGFDYAGG